MIRRISTLIFSLLTGTLAASIAQTAGDWQPIQVPGAWENAGPASARGHDGFAWYRAWFMPHESFFIPHERDLFAESVILNIRGLADAHEVFVNGTRIGGGGSFPPDFAPSAEGSHRHKIPPGLPRKGEWNEIAIRVYNESGPGGFLKEAPFVMNYFNECVLQGEWEWRAGDNPAWAGGPLKEKPPRAAFDAYRESSGVLGEAAEFVHGPKLPPAESAAMLTAAGDLTVEQLLHEPLVAQPTHLAYDARGRLWIAQYRQYPYPAGVKMLSRDKYYRAQYDKVPPPPPNHHPGRDRISIHEDTDGDGRFDRHKIFVDGLNLANASLPGPKGVWVMNPPYLLFYPDADRDDVPDAAPAVHLSGFGLEDTHSVANGLVWGPDGWIYGAQGSTTSSRVVRPGLDDPEEGVYFEGCMVWRYHPKTRDYEIFAEGSGNVFGLEFDGEGRLFSGHNGPETRGWHYMQGAYYMKQGVNPGKFGPGRNPYAFGELPWLQNEGPIQRFTHFLAVVEGTAMPSSRQGQLFWIDPIHSLILAGERTPRGSTFGTRDLGQVLTSADEAFRPVFIVNAPDGSLHVADFYDYYIAHGQHYQSQIDPTTGRIYRLRGRASSLETDVNLAAKTTDELLELLSHPNKWHRHTAARLLGWRAAPDVIEKTRALLASPSAPIGALWALNLAGGLDEPAALAALKHPSPLIREWTVRLLGDRKQVSEVLAHALRDQARIEPGVRVRAQMAASARRLPPSQGLPLVAALFTHGEDAADPCVPLLCWWVLETHIAQDREAVLALFDDPETWNSPIVREHILPRVMRRFALEGRRQDLLVCARLLRAAPSESHAAQLIKGFEQAYRGRAMTGLPNELLAALGEAGSTPLVLRLRQRQPDAIQEALALARDAGADLEARVQSVRALGEIRESKAEPVLLSIALGAHPAALRKAAFAALSVFEGDALGERVAGALPKLPADIRHSALAMLVRRPDWSLALLRTLESGRVEPSLLTPDIAGRLRESSDKRVAALALKLLPRGIDSTSAVLQKRIPEIKAILSGAPGNPYAGQSLYAERCAACHQLFFKGGAIGPDLTAYQRDNLQTLLTSILDPNAEIREGYAYVEIETADGRTLGGFIRDQDAQVTVLRGLDGQDLTLRADDILAIKPAGRSLMPEGLLDGLDETQLRDLFAFLRQSQPFTP